MSREKKITEAYFHGTIKAVATQVAMSETYVGDVLSGKYPEAKPSIFLYNYQFKRVVFLLCFPYVK